MKIAFIDYTQSYGGSNRATIQMVQNLQQEGHTVYLFDFYGNCDAYVLDCKNNLGPFFKIINKSNPYFIQAEKNVFKQFCNIIRFLPHMLLMNKVLNNLLKDYEIEYCCCSTIRPLLCMAFRKPKAKIVYFAHGWYLKKQVSFLLRFLLKKYVSKIVAISEATRQSLFNIGVSSLENIHVVHNYIEKAENKRYEKVDSINAPFIINHCGAFIKGKGQHIAVEIAKELRTRGLNFKMRLTGMIYAFKSSQSYYERVVQMIKENDLSDHIEIVLNKNNVLDYTSQCDVLIHPSSSEGFPLAILEAQILGKPVIANAVGGIPDMIVDNYNGFLVSYNNPKDYAERIVELANDRTLYNLMSERSFIFASKCFSKEIQKEKLRKVFE